MIAPPRTTPASASQSSTVTWRRAIEGVVVRRRGGARRSSGAYSTNARSTRRRSSGPSAGRPSARPGPDADPRSRARVGSRYGGTRRARRVGDRLRDAGRKASHHEVRCAEAEPQAPTTASCGRLAHRPVLAIPGPLERGGGGGALRIALRPDTAEEVPLPGSSAITAPSASASACVARWMAAGSSPSVRIVDRPRARTCRGRCAGTRRQHRCAGSRGERGRTGGNVVGAAEELDRYVTRAVAAIAEQDEAPAVAQHLEQGAQVAPADEMQARAARAPPSGGRTAGRRWCRRRPRGARSPARWSAGPIMSIRRRGPCTRARRSPRREPRAAPRRCRSRSCVGRPRRDSAARRMTSTRYLA